jgi:hypothetical protein
MQDLHKKTFETAGLARGVHGGLTLRVSDFRQSSANRSPTYKEIVFNSVRPIMDAKTHRKVMPIVRRSIVRMATMIMGTTLTLM